MDYVAPMVYPDHWGRGEYDVRRPEAQPYDIVFRSLVDFQSAVEPMGRAVVPWLQDYTRPASPTARPRCKPRCRRRRTAASTAGCSGDPDTEYSIDGYPPLS